MKWTELELLIGRWIGREKENKMKTQNYNSKKKEHNQS